MPDVSFTSRRRLVKGSWCFIETVCHSNPARVSFAEESRETRKRGGMVGFLGRGR